MCTRATSARSTHRSTACTSCRARRVSTTAPGALREHVGRLCTAWWDSRGPADPRQFVTRRSPTTRRAEAQSARPRPARDFPAHATASHWCPRQSLDVPRLTRFARGHEVRAFDLPSRANRRVRAPSIPARRGDLRQRALGRGRRPRRPWRRRRRARRCRSCRPRARERSRGRAGGEREGRREACCAFEAEKPSGPFVLASSFACTAPERLDVRLRLGETPVAATYAHTTSKLAAEALLRASTAPVGHPADRSGASRRARARAIPS